MIELRRFESANVPDRISLPKPLAQSSLPDLDAGGAVYSAVRRSEGTETSVFLHQHNTGA